MRHQSREFGGLAFLLLVIACVGLVPGHAGGHCTSLPPAVLASTAAQDDPAKDEVQPRVGEFGPVTPGALPFTYEVRELESPPGMPPELHSFSYAALDDGHWVMLGGRGNAAGANVDKTGLHGFSPSNAPGTAKNNFPRPSFHKQIFVYNPTSGATASFDTTQLDSSLAAPLQATSQQFWYERETDMLWLLGGYGWNEDHTDMITFDTLIRVPATKLCQAILNGDPAEDVGALFEMLTGDDAPDGEGHMMAVTGGDMVKIGNVLYVVFGQRFDGQYFAFGEEPAEPFVQVYTREIRALTLVPGQFKILDISPVGNADPEECNRRDLNVRMTRDAVTGKPRIGVYGGVFRRGGPGGFDKPMLFDPNFGLISIQHDGSQLFNAYTTAVTSLWCEDAGVMSQVFFGGIGRGVYHQHNQFPGLDNDGMPFGSDLSVFNHYANGAWKEFVLPDPVPGNRLLASNGHFIIDPNLRASGWVSDDQIVLVDELPKGQSTVIGWVYGGILADLPQPPKGPPDPNHKGAVEVPSKATNTIFEISITPTPGPAIPVLGDGSSDPVTVTPPSDGGDPVHDGGHVPSGGGSGDGDRDLGVVLRGTRVLAASPETARAHLTRRDSFVRNQSRFDRQARMNVPADALAVTEEIYFQYLMSQVRPWSEAELGALGKIVDGVAQRFEKIEMQLPDSVWLVKTTGEEEGHAAYTRGHDTIVLPANMVATLWAGGGDALHPEPSVEALEDIVTHEFFHLFSKNNPERRHALYGLVGYEQFDEPVMLPNVPWGDGTMAELKITNPDTPALNVCVRMRAPSGGPARPWLPVLLSKERYTSGSFFGDMQWWFMALEQQGGAWVPVMGPGGTPVMATSDEMMPQYMRIIGRNLNEEIFHPDEILAQNFVLAVKEPSLSLLQSITDEIERDD